MESLIYVSASHDDAVKVFEDLKDAGYSDSQLEFINREDIVNNHLSVMHDIRVEGIEAAVCAGIGLVIGVMLATGAIHLRDASFTSFKGFAVAMCVGTAAGLLSGGIVACLTFPALQWLHNARYQHLLENGKFLIFVKGNPDEIAHAEKVAHNEVGLHWQFS